MRLVQRASATGAPGLCVLAYHLVGAGTTTHIDLPLKVFKQQLCGLSEKYGAGVGGDLADAWDAGSGPTDKGCRVVVTFDDAYLNFYSTVFPLLVESEVPAILYVPTGFVDGTAPPPIAGTEGLPACSWSQLREMTASGWVTVGAHTCTHPSLTHVSRLRAEWEIATSKKVLEDKLGTPVTSFCYPRALWNRELEAIVREHYETAVVGGGVHATTGTFDPYRIQRVSIRRDMPASLEPILASRVWLEEWAADRVRHLRDRWRSRQAGGGKI